MQTTVPLPGQGNIFTPKSEPLGDLLGGIHRHKVALPNFQRPWVWAPDMVRELLISVGYRYPAGSLLTMPVDRANLGLRPFEGAGETLRVKPSVMVLDGQQRLTSLYQALYTREGVRVRGRVYHFYLDVPVLMSDPDGSIEIGDPFLEEALFYVQEDKKGRRFRYDGLQRRHELSTPEDELAAGALPLACLFDPDGRLASWKEKYLLGQAEGTLDRYVELSKQWDHLVAPWLDRIRNYPFPVVELRADMPLGAICHIFEKVNSTGVALDVFDLCNAILWAQGMQLNRAWEETRQALAPALRMQPLSGTAFLQGLSLLASFERKCGSRDERVAVTCRKNALMAMDRATVEQWWPVLVDGYREAAKFMDSQGVRARRILPYTTLIVPLSAVLGYLRRSRGEAYIGEAWAKVERWYWCSVFSQRYSGQVESGSAQDMEQVINWVQGGDPPDVVRAFTFRPESLPEVTSIRNAIYKGLLCLLARNGAKDFGGAGELSVSLFYDTRQDHHHIFPRAAFGKLGIDDPRRETILNKTLIGAAFNRSIGGGRPSEYVERMRSRLQRDTCDSILRSHAIDPDLLAADEWDAFVLDRRERLRQMIADACGANVQPFSDVDLDEIEVEEPEDDEEMEV